MSDPILLVFDFPGPDGASCRRVFRDPVAVFRADALDDVLGTLRAAEQAVAGGLYVAGFVAYDAAGAFDPAMTASRRPAVPLAWFAAFDGPSTEALPELGGVRVGAYEPDESRDNYFAAIERIHAHIEAGDTYQVNHTFRIRADFDGDPLAYYLRLTEAHPATYAAYLDTGSAAILSISPELFFRQEGRVVTTKPIKGTATRGLYPLADRNAQAMLAASVKDRAENVMIVDLMRSDLGKLAVIGSVKTARLFEIEPLPTLWQMSSTVQAEMPPGIGFVDVLKATFPAGSITGAPKPITTRIIRDLEPSPRGIYCGTIGLVSPGGDATFNVAIRTVTIDKAVGTAECGVGGGITISSVASSEYAEAISKASFLIAEPPSYSLLESLRWDEDGYFLLERHIKRMLESAARLGFTVDSDGIRTVLAVHATTLQVAPRKVRLCVDHRGLCEVTSSPLGDEPVDPVFALADTPIDNGDLFLYHKTTRREVYDRHFASKQGVYDVLLWNAEGYVTEFTRGNIAVRIDGDLVTPPLGHGLLDGTFRQELIDTNQVVVGGIRRDKMENFDEVWFYNSVRKWVRVRLATP